MRLATATVLALVLTACGSGSSQRPDGGGGGSAPTGGAGPATGGSGSGGRAGTGGSGSGGVTGSGGAAGSASTGGSGGAPGSGGSAGTGGRGGTIGTGGGAAGAGAGGSAGRPGTGGGSAGRGGAGGADGRKACQADTECQGFKCCGGFCVNRANDILNCGTCGNACAGDRPFCANGTCQNTWPCTVPGTVCGQGTTCCGGQCCTGGQVCCNVNVGPSVTGCFEPVNGTCPMGCLECVCAAPSTPIATPGGDRPIAELKAGDLVYSVHRGALAVVPIKFVHREPVVGSHRVVELRLAHGATLRISPKHPTADGRTFADLLAGDVLDGVGVMGARLVDYDQPFTHDILPDSDSGTYFAGGTLIGSTLSRGFGQLSTSAPVATGTVRRASLLPR